MDDSSRIVPLTRRVLDWLLHPIVLFLLVGVTVYSKLFVSNRVSTLVSAVLSGLVVTLITRFYYAARQIRRTLENVERERDRVWTPQIEAEWLQLRKGIAATSAPTWVSITSRPKRHSSVSEGESAIYVRGLDLENIRCFNRFALSLEDEQGPYLTTVLLGDNAAGKSTILRSIALGLCPESDATSLMKGLSGSFLRKGASHGSVLLHLRSTDNTFSGTIRTTIEQTSSGGEIIRQITEPVDFPWKQIFVCGYGTHRSSGRPSSHQMYSAREAVGTLFSDAADLLNPEVVLLRRDLETRRRLELILKQILLLEDAESGIRASDRGIELEGPWGNQPLSAVSDGYRSTSQWVLDYLGWQLFADRLHDGAIEGILLIDELEQHLHPRWQRYFIQRLRAQFDQTQIIASSHTPLLAAGVADVQRSQVVRLVPTGDGSVETLKIPPEQLTGKRADQILADAFGLITSKSPGSVAKVDRYTELLSRKRNYIEQNEFEILKKELEDTWSSGDHALKRVADDAVSKVLDSMIDEGQDRQIVDAQVKQRLQDLFSKKEGRP